jgi:alpha-N-arabinofuranosidase
LNFNIFHDHSDRVRMANIAQMVNVLQSVILTEGEHMILTPTYHVFNMYKVHQDAKLLQLELQSDDYTSNGKSIKAVSATASVDAEGRINISLAHVNPQQATELNIDLRGLVNEQFSVTATTITADSMDAHNTFEAPEVVKPQSFTAYEVNGYSLKLTLAPMSVTTISIA